MSRYLAMPERWRGFSLWLALLVLTIIGSLIPDRGPVRAISDDRAHLPVYLLLTAATALLLAKGRSARPSRAVAGAAAGISLLGVGLELLQPLTGRTSAVHDLLANEAGVALGAMVAIALLRGRAGGERRR